MVWLWSDVGLGALLFFDVFFWIEFLLCVFYCFLLILVDLGCPKQPQIGEQLLQIRAPEKAHILHRFSLVFY